MQGSVSVKRHIISMQNIEKNNTKKEKRVFMSKKRRNKKSLHLTDKKHPMLAIIATGLGFLSIVLFFASIFDKGIVKPKCP